MAYEPQGGPPRNIPSAKELEMRRAGLVPKAASWLLARLADVPRLVDLTTRFLGVLRDAIRLGEYELGPPFIYASSFEVPGGGAIVHPISVPADGEVVFFSFGTENITVPTTDPRNLIVFEELSVGSQKFFSNESGAFLVQPTSGSLGPFERQGFLRRIRVRQSQEWKFRVSNQGADTYQVSIFFSQYADYDAPLVATPTRTSYLTSR